MQEQAPPGLLPPVAPLEPPRLMDPAREVIDLLSSTTKHRSSSTRSNKTESNSSNPLSSTPGHTAAAAIIMIATLGAAAKGQNTGGVVKKGQVARADQVSQARACKIAKWKRHGALPGGMGLLGDTLDLQVMGMGLQFPEFCLGVIEGDPLVDMVQAS
eukprot:1159813-Pelagomonas_calceolata.AAC.15